MVHNINLGIFNKKKKKKYIGMYIYNIYNISTKGSKIIKMHRKRAKEWPFN